MTFYRIEEKPAGLLLIVDTSVGQQLWSLTNSGVRKTHTCQLCGRRILKGERAYRPITNQRNRMDRFCVDCVDTWPDLSRWGQHHEDHLEENDHAN